MDFTNLLDSQNFIDSEPECVSSYNKYENVILDMDGCILDNIPYDLQDKSYKLVNKKVLCQPIARPYLKDFMDYVFRHFKRVSIWTAGQKIWYNQCYNEVLRKYIPEGKSFDFVLTRETGGYFYPVKPLSFIYQTKPGYNSTNTLIVDDNPMTYSTNIENAIGIKSFFFDYLTKEQRKNLDRYDFELLKVIVIMDKMLNGEKISANPLSDMKTVLSENPTMPIPPPLSPLPETIILKRVEDEDLDDLYV